MLNTVMLTETAAALVGIPQGAPVNNTARLTPWASGVALRESYWRQGVIGINGSGPAMSASTPRGRTPAVRGGVQLGGAAQFGIVWLAAARPTQEKSAT